MRGADGGLRRKVSAPSSSLGIPRCWSTGFTSNLSMEDFRFCRRSSAARFRPPRDCLRFFWPCWGFRCYAPDRRSGKSGLPSRVRRQLLRLRDLDDDFAGLRQAEFIAGDFFDFVRIRFQFFYFLLELQILLVQLIETGVHLLDFQLRAAHGQEAVRAEDVVHNEKEHQQAEESAPMLAQKRPDFLACIRLVQFFKTHADASPVSSAEAPALSASTYA